MSTHAYTRLQMLRGCLCSKLQQFTIWQRRVWAGIQHGSKMALLQVAGALTGIEILQRHIILYMNLNGGMFQPDSAIPRYMC